MIIEPIWRPTRRLIAWFVDDRAIICKAGCQLPLGMVHFDTHHYATK